MKDVPGIFFKTVKVVFAFSVLFVVSCSEKKPVYDLGPVRAPQDNPGIVDSMRNKQQQAPQPPVPGYDIPAPRYNDNPMMIDAPGMMTPNQPSIMQPQRPLPPQSYNQQPYNNASAEPRRRPARQFSGAPLPYEVLQFASKSPYQPSYQPTQVAEAKKKPSFFDRLKNVFRKDSPAPEQKQPSQPYRYSRAQEPQPSRQPSEPSLDEELKTLPLSPAEKAAGDKSKWIPPEEAEKKSNDSNKVMAGATAAQTPVAKTKKGFQFKIKPPSEWFKKDAQNQGNAPKQISPASTPKGNVNGSLGGQKPVDDGKTLWETKKINEKSLETIPEDVDQTGADAVKAKGDGAKPAEEAEVLMEFDISEDGELVELQDIAPAAGE